MFITKKKNIQRRCLYQIYGRSRKRKNPNTLRIVKTNEEGDVLVTDVEYLQKKENLK